MRTLFDKIAQRFWTHVVRPEGVSRPGGESIPLSAKQPGSRWVSVLRLAAAFIFARHASTSPRSLRAASGPSGAHGAIQRPSSLWFDWQPAARRTGIYPVNFLKRLRMVPEMELRTS